MFENIKGYIMYHFEKNFATIFYIITSLIICIIAKFLTIIICIPNDISVFPHFQFLFFPNKFYEIINYILGAGILFVMFMLYPVYNRHSINFKFTNIYNLFFLDILLLLIFVNIKTSSIKCAFISIFVLITLYFVNFYIAKIKIPIDFVNKIFFKINITKIMVAISILIFVFQIFPFVFQRLKVINEFSDIPEQTIINDHKIINNLDYEASPYFSSYYNYQFLKGNIFKKYLEYNNFEIHWKTLSRWVLYHHSHMFVPILELELGKDKSQIFAQYGLINANLLRIALKYTGGISIDTYFKLYYSLFYLYYGLLFFIAFKIFKKSKYVYILLLSTIISINIYNFYYFYLAPGCNPIRHFFDIIVIYCLYKYFGNYKIKYFITATILSLLAVLLNNSMGLFLYLALFPVFVYKKIISVEKINCLKEFIILLCSLVLFPFLYKCSTMGVDYTKEYFVSGLLGWHLPTLILHIILIILTICYILFAHIALHNKKSNLKFLSFFVYIYIQGLLLYYIWASDMKHFVVIMPVITFMFLMLFKLISDVYLKNKIITIRKLGSNITIILLFVISLVGSGIYFRDYLNFNKLFKVHTTYNWELKNAKFLSTMNPAYFTDSIDLIKKYTPNENGIYIISKYDHFIPFLADKYTLMPYLNLEWYTLSKNEVDNIINLIKTKQPEILYVDKNFMYKNNGTFSVYHYGLSYLNLERLAHNTRVTVLETIFNEIIKDYEPIESSYLLTVYRRKK